MLRVKDYHHVAVVVRDLEKSRWFYGEVLGLTSIERPPFNFPGHWFQVGEVCQLHLMVLEEEIPATMRHVALEVEDFDKAVEYLRASRIEIVEGPGKRVDGSDYFFCRDPDGRNSRTHRHDYFFCRDPDGNLVEITRH